MKQRVLDLLDGEGRGVVTTSELRGMGIGPAVLRSLLREGSIVRVARGAYVSTARLKADPADGEVPGPARLAERRHLLYLDAILRSYGGRAGASHQSAALAWGFPVLSWTLDRLHVSHTRKGATGRKHDTFTIHRCEHDDAFARHDGRRLVVPALAVIGTTIVSGLKAGLVATDGALRHGRTTQSELKEWLARMSRHPGLSTARAVVDLADPRAESAGETLLRLILVRLGVRFVPQHWVRTSDGSSYCVDFYLPDLGVVLEFDGLTKYAVRPARASRPSSATGTGQRGSNGVPNALAAEKLREDALRAEGYGVGRVVWSGLTTAAVTATVRAAAGQAQARARHRESTPPPWATR